MKIKKQMPVTLGVRAVCYLSILGLPQAIRSLFPGGQVKWGTDQGARHGLGLEPG